MIQVELTSSPHSVAVGAVHIHGNVEQVQAGSVRSAGSADLTLTQPATVQEEPQSQRGVQTRGRGAQRGRGRGRAASPPAGSVRSVLDPPTHRQINYIAAICFRRGWNWELAMADLQLEAEASAWIDTHK